MPENPPLAELKAVKLADYYNLAAIRAKILQIKEAVTNNLNSGFHHTRPVCCSNYTVPKSNCSHFFVCSSLGHAKSVCPHRNLNPKKTLYGLLKMDSTDLNKQKPKGSKNKAICQLNSRRDIIWVTSQHTINLNKFLDILQSLP